MEETGSSPAPLGWWRARELLASAGVGRLVFTEQGLPAVRTVPFTVEGTVIRIELPPGAGLARTMRHAIGAVVAVHADRLDDPGGGWEVTAVGTVRTGDTGDRIGPAGAHRDAPHGRSGDGSLLIDVRHLSGRRVPRRPEPPGQPRRHPSRDSPEEASFT